MFEIEDAEIRRPAERVQQAPIVEFAAQLAERLGLVVAARDRSERSKPRAQPRLPDPCAQRAAGHGPRTRCRSIPCRHAPAIPDRLAWNSDAGSHANPACSPPLRQRCRFRRAMRRPYRARVQKAPGYSRVSPNSPQGSSAGSTFTLNSSSEAWSPPGQQIVTRSLPVESARVHADGVRVLLFSAVDIVDARFCTR